MRIKLTILTLIAMAALSCTHWIVGSESRIQIENDTGGAISNLSIVSESGQVHVLIPVVVESGQKSKVYETEWVGEFNFAVYAGDSITHLGRHKLKSGSVLARIKEESGKLVAVFR